MINYTYQIKILIKRLLICYAVYFLCRLVFFLANISAFPSVTFVGFISDSINGLRFDTFSIFVSNSLFILLSAIPAGFVYNKIYQRILKWIFVLFNSIFTLTNCIDIGYFKFINKRSGSDLFHQVGGQTDILKLLPQYLLDFWWILLVYILMIILFVWLYNKIKIVPEKAQKTIGKGKIVLNYLSFILVAGFTTLGIRGGLQRIPIDIVDAGAVAGPDEAAIVMNTPFTIIKSFDKSSLTEFNFYNENKLKEVFNPVHHFSDQTFNKQNVVVILLESFAKEYTKLGRTVSYTPFLDSLMDHGLVFTNAYANGMKSIEGIPAVLSSMPTLMENPVINSPYSNNYQTSFASVLNKEGYTTAFFHGGINGTMNFDAYAKLAGYQYYYGKNEYGNEHDFDGFWGIWDEPFLQYSIKKMSAYKEPFHTAIFTLSSHHPYVIPKKYKNKFPKGHLENSESIGYADYALKQFFNTAKKTKWYNNTLFVICADHSSISEHRYFSNHIGLKSIPILYFKPDNNLKGQNDSSFSQIDILPSTLALLGYNKPFFAFGQNFKKKQNNNCYYSYGGTNFVVRDTLLFCYNGTDLQIVNNVKRDSFLTINFIHQYPEIEKQVDSEFKAFLQTYNHTLISNTGVVK